MKKFIFFGYTITQIFYILWYIKFNYIFGKIDVDNYFFLASKELNGLAIKHIFIQFLINNLSMAAFVFLIPLTYWYGLAEPIRRLKGNDTLFIFVFGTASMQLFFIVSLWSQFISLAFFIWGIYFIHIKKINYGLIFIIFSLSYIPMGYFIIMVISYPLFILFTILLMSIYPGTFWWSYGNYVPILSLIFYICPILVYKIFFGNTQWSNKLKSIFFILSINILSRGLIFLFPQIDFKLTKGEKALLILWWALITVFFFYSFYLEAIAPNTRIFHYLF